jgi:hypothetical protein
MAGEHRKVFGPALLCSILVAGLAPANAQEKRTSLPDWSGWWAQNSPFMDELVRAPPPMKAGEFARFRAARSQDSDPDPARYCRPPVFVGYSGGFAESIELLFTPGRVTLTNESGLIRRIYTDGRSLPTDYDYTNTGTSVGRWEGQTLVIETVGINPAARYPIATQGAMPIGKNVKITERISLQGPDTLQFDVTTVAPDLFIAPDQRKRIYARVPKKATANEITFCVDHDRTIDPGTGKQRFDMAPPPDLPPPPPPPG